MPKQVPQVRIDAVDWRRRKIPAKLDSKRTLNPRQCLEVRDAIFDLRKQWIRRNPGRPYYTLFGACYLDAKTPRGRREVYEKRVERFNPVLKRHFSGLYEAMFRRLSQLMKLPVVPHPELGLPGFHVYLEKDGVFGPVCVTHFDVQYRWLDWSSVPKADFGQVITFVLPIVVPSCGTGLDCWAVDYLDFVTRPGVPLARLLRKAARKHYPYTAGKLFVMEGLYAHQIPPMKGFKKGDLRITLQGHAVRAGNRWIAYW